MCITIEIKNPITPINNIPIADNFEIFLNSCMLGFLKICHTLEHFAKNDFVFSPIAMIMRQIGSF